LSSKYDGCLPNAVKPRLHFPRYSQTKPVISFRPGNGSSQLETLNLPVQSSSRIRHPTSATPGGARSPYRTIQRDSAWLTSRELTLAIATKPSSAGGIVGILGSEPVHHAAVVLAPSQLKQAISHGRARRERTAPRSICATEYIGRFHHGENFDQFPKAGQNPVGHPAWRTYPQSGLELGSMDMSNTATEPREGHQCRQQGCRGLHLDQQRHGLHIIEWSASPVFVHGLPGSIL
jgi:hypothetical protein